MIIRSTSNFEKKVRKLKTKDESLKKRIDSKLKVLLQNPKHPSLRIHKLVSIRHEAWSISVNMQLRILFVYRDYGVLLIDISGHDEVY